MTIGKGACPRHPMRRAKQELPLKECRAILERGTSGVLALGQGDGGYPYAVPLSYACLWPDAASDESAARPGQSGEVSPSLLGSLIFHSAVSGHKIDALARDSRASFCVIDQDQVVPEEYTTYFRSVIAFGTVRVVDDPAEARRLLEVLGQKYYPGHLDEQEREISGSLERTKVLEFRIEQLTGKEARELARQRS